MAFSFNFFKEDAATSTAVKHYIDEGVEEHSLLHPAREFFLVESSEAIVANSGDCEVKINDEIVLYKVFRIFILSMYGNYIFIFICLSNNISCETIY